MAGVNAARRAQELSPVILPRNSSYIGTLLDDLVTKVLQLSPPYSPAASSRDSAL